MACGRRREEIKGKIEPDNLKAEFCNFRMPQEPIIGRTSHNSAYTATAARLQLVFAPD
jgi:hypothetical protein